MRTQSPASVLRDAEDAELLLGQSIKATVPYPVLSSRVECTIAYLVEPCLDSPLPLLVEVTIRHHIVVLHHLAAGPC